MTDGSDEHSTAEFHTRAIADYSQFSQHLRTCLQFVFAANGGAALAMLSCLTAVATAKDLNSQISIKILLFRFACSAAFYLGGVFCTMLAVIAFAISQQNWGHFWEDNALLREVDFGKSFARRGEAFSRIAFILLLIGAICFIPGSAMAITAFFP
jgi:hypothetical protein